MGKGAGQLALKSPAAQLKAVSLPMFLLPGRYFVV
jgi:hypothetical protein